jgi:RNA polymerase sigma factor (TIGR02999 family)
MANPRDDRPADASQAAADLMPAVYAELRRLAESLTRQLRPGQTLQATALVHEAYLRLVRDQDPGWDGRRHFFAAAARAMREILIEQARRKATRKHGGPGRRVELVEGLAVLEPPAEDLLALAEVVLLRYYAGLGVQETAVVLGESERTVYRDWRRARAWLARRLGPGGAGAVP